MTNQEMAQSLKALAEVYEKPENEALSQPVWAIYVYGKEELLAVFRAIGGKWIKVLPKDNDFDLRFRSALISGLEISIPRDKVCKKIVRWECEPLLSREEIAEVEQISA